MASGGRVPNNSTSLSLHERFSKLRSSAGGQKLAGKLQGARNNAANLQKASSKNSRLAQQMERRNASVSAALKLKKKSIKQRLGATVNTSTRFRGTATQTQRRLTTNRGAGRGSQSRGSLRGSRTQGQTVTPTKIIRGRGGLKPIVSQTIVRGGGQGNKRSTRGRIISPSKKPAPVAATTNRSPTKPSRARGSVRGRRGGRGQMTSSLITGQAESRIQRGRGRGRGQRGGKGPSRGGSSLPTSPRGQTSGRGRGRGRGGSTKVSKEDLDKQLDQYMQKTRSALDNDIESYMSKIGDVEMN
ncbi:chromatin target of PRMT1 protein-like [Daphnia pulex]|uniref:chromatin target of PRMT1 protein-like n=1 Tax=Daphnia pulex TaxID=6669 RepID=UPI001EDF4AF1|nr:chromatin target of PRMT1 protein-like [Daphnia pulex]